MNSEATLLLALFIPLLSAFFIAANDDRLNLAFEGTVVPGAFEGEWWTDENGTGRFDGVTGSGVYWGGFDGEEWHLYMEGTLTKP